MLLEMQGIVPSTTAVESGCVAATMMNAVALYIRKEVVLSAL